MKFLNKSPASIKRPRAATSQCKTNMYCIASAIISACRLKKIKAEERLYPGCIDGHKFLHISQESLLPDSEKCIPIWCCRCPRGDMSEGGSIRSFISFFGFYEAI